MIKRVYCLSKDDFESIQALLDTAISKAKNIDRANYGYESSQIQSLLRRVKNYLREKGDTCG